MRAEAIADDLWRLQGGPGHCNVFFLRTGDGGVTLFDAGAKAMRGKIAAAAAELGGLREIVLGHAHTDHRGAAPRLGVPVRCHRDAVAEAEGRGGWEYWDPRLTFLPQPIRLVHRLLHRFAWDGGPVRITGTVEPGDEVAAGFRVVELSGHAPGQIALWREADRIALTTDVFYVVDMWGRPGPPLPPTEGYSQDPAKARAAILALADLEPAVCWPGHGAALRATPGGTSVADQLRAGAA